MAALDFPSKDKMMKAAPLKKGFHFASNGIHPAMYIEAETIEEAEKIYHKHIAKQSTAPAAEAEEENKVQ